MIPATKFPHPGTGRVRPGLSDRRQRPEQVEVVAGVSAVPFIAMGCKGHASEIVGTAGFAKSVEQHGRHSTFAIVFVGFSPCRMIAVGNSSFACVKSKQSRTEVDRAVNFGVRQTRVASQDQPDRQWQPGGVHHAIALQATVRQGKSVSPGTNRTLAIRRLQCQPTKPRQHSDVVRSHDVFGQKNHHVTVVPRSEVRCCEVCGPLCLAPHQRDMRWIASGKQCEGVETAWNRISGLRVIRCRHAFSERCEALLEYALRLWTVIGSSGAE